MQSLAKECECGRINPSSRVLCTRCGTKLPTQKELTDKYMVCNFCGERTVGRLHYCPKCKKYIQRKRSEDDADN